LGSGLDQPFFVHEEFETQGEEKIRTLPNPLSLQIQLDGKSPEVLEQYRQTLDMRTGSLATSWRSGKWQVTSETVIHSVERVIAQKWTFVPPERRLISLKHEWPGTRVVQQSQSDVVAEWPVSGLRAKLQRTVEAEIAAETSGQGNWELSRQTDQPVTIYLAASIGISPNIVSLLGARGVAVTVTETAFQPTTLYSTAKQSFEGSSEACRRHWQKRWQTDIEIDGPVEDQQAIRSFLFYLSSASHPGARMSYSPFALGNQQYNGHVFWDADIWVFPALALVNPQAAKGIADYRLELQAGYRRNYVQWVRDGRPTAELKPGGGPPASNAIMVPWESGVTGMETVPGPSRHQHHITGSVTFMLNQAAGLGLADPVRVRSFGEAAANFWIERSTRNSKGLREIAGVMSPDEHHIGDNDLYTNLLAEWTINRYSDRKVQFELPKDEKSLLTYEGDDFKGYKQAAAVLSIYPLQNPIAEKQAHTMMERFPPNVIASGPAMSESVDALIWARLGKTPEAYTAWRKSWVPFADNGLLLFSEKRHRPIDYFVTGAGGSLQTVLYGFMGLRIQAEEPKNVPWKVPLREGQWLSARPNLPQEWKRLTLRSVTVLGRRYTFTAVRDSGKTSLSVQEETKR
jgi:trehalose/maltose hydrolase-like predicted phosphorylase